MSSISFGITDKIALLLFNRSKKVHLLSQNNKPYTLAYLKQLFLWVTTLNAAFSANRKEYFYNCSDNGCIENSTIYEFAAVNTFYMQRKTKMHKRIDKQRVDD